MWRAVASREASYRALLHRCGCGGGHGRGEGCVLCDTMIKPSEIALEVEESVEGKIKALWFHIVCQSIWQLECACAEYLKNRVVSPDV
jgi:hypothetical protein